MGQVRLVHQSDMPGAVNVNNVVYLLCDSLALVSGNTGSVH